MKKQHGKRRLLQRVLHGLISLALLISLISTSGMQPVTAISEQGRLHAKAPVSPDFLEDMRNKGARPSQEMEEIQRLGYIPSPLKRSKKELASESMAPLALTADALPAYYDLRGTSGSEFVSPVKNQGSSGSCWTFATFGSMESALIKQSGSLYDFSENNLKNTHGFDFEANSGGNASMATAYLARWSGPVDESADSYNDESTSSPSDLPDLFHTQDVSFIPADVTSVK